MQRILYIIFFFLQLGSRLFAQDTDDESKANAYFDNRETIEILSAEAAQGSNVFSDVKDLKEARAFKSDKGGYVVEFKDNDNDFSYKAYTEQEFEEIRQKITNYFIAQDRHSKSDVIFKPRKNGTNGNNKRIQYSQYYETEINESGRNTFIVSSTLLGAFLYGPAVGHLASKSDSGTATLPWIGMMYGTTIAAWQYAEHHPVSYGAATQYMGSNILGQLHGPIIYDMIESEQKNKTLKGSTGVSFLTSATEGALGLYLAQKSGISPGQSIMATGTAFWMIPEAYALVLGFNKTYNVRDQAIVNSFVLGMSFYGYYLGYSLTKTFSYTIGDAIVYNNVMMLSACAFVSLASSINKNTINAGNINLFGGLTSLFAPIGIYASEALLKGHDFKAGQGVVISLATFTGGIASTIALRKKRTSDIPFDFRILQHFCYGAIPAFTLAYLYETKYAQTGLLGKLNDQNMRLAPTMCNMSPQGQFPSFNNMTLGFQFDWKF